MEAIAQNETAIAVINCGVGSIRIRYHFYIGSILNKNL